MRKTKDFDIRKVSRISNGYGVFLTKEVRKLGWGENTFVTVRIEDNEIVLKKIEINEK